MSTTALSGQVQWLGPLTVLLIVSSYLVNKTILKADTVINYSIHPLSSSLCSIQGYLRNIAVSHGALRDRGPAAGLMDHSKVTKQNYWLYGIIHLLKHFCWVWSTSHHSILQSHPTFKKCILKAQGDHQLSSFVETRGYQTVSCRGPSVELLLAQESAIHCLYVIT